MSGLFPKVKTPRIPPPTRMPDEADPAVLEAQRRKRAEMALRGGRQSTILTDALGDKVGGKLGAR